MTGKEIALVYLLPMGHRRLLLCLFSVFSNTKTMLKQTNVKNGPSSIRCWDMNSLPLEHESPPATTRPVANLIKPLRS